MKNLVIQKFIDWYVDNNHKQSSNYLENYFKNDKNYFKIKLQEIGDEFFKSFQINPFDLNLETITENEISSISYKLESKDNSFSIYNKKYGNGVPRAILGKRNYLLFLSDLLIEKDERNLLNTTFYLRKEFISYLINEENFTVGSANSYASYVSSAQKQILNKHQEVDFFKSIETLYKADLCIELEDFLDISINLVRKFTDTVNKNKYSAGLTEYKYFLIDKFEIPNESEQFTNKNPPVTIANEVIEKIRKEIENESETVFEIDKNSLIANFRFRMITQDRLYGDVYFPIRLLKKIFYKDKENKVIFDEFILNQIENIKIFNSKNKGSYSILKSIDSLSIDTNNQVQCGIVAGDICLQGLIYTELGDEGTYELFTAKKLREIAIDHIVPMKDLLNEYKNQLTGLLNLTNILKERGLIKSGKDSIKQLAVIGNQLFDEEILTDNDINLLKIDLKFLGSKIHLQLMSSKENLKKKNR